MYKRQLYVSQSKIVERLSSDSSKNELVLWDVGLGAAFNAVATIRAVEKITDIKVPLKIISFESDLDALRLVLKYNSHFPHIHHPAPKSLLENGKWSHKTLPITWELLEGDFADRYLTAPIPDVIYWDPFSARSDQRLWGINIWRELWQKVSEHESMLITYSASTAVRAGLLAAGFVVGIGSETGPKKETTLALTPKALPLYPDIQILDKKWLSRWERSDARYPFGITENDFQQIDALISNHSQFCD